MYSLIIRLKATPRSSQILLLEKLVQLEQVETIGSFRICTLFVAPLTTNERSPNVN
jgi:hypothetical protein